jgi:hypothetical protein
MLLPTLRSLVLAFLFVFAAAAFAENTVTLQQDLNTYGGTTDTQIASFAPITNYGSSDVILVERPTQRSVLVRFAIFAAEGGPVPDNATITSATLSLYKYWGAAATIKASRVKRSWNEMQATWNVAATGTSWEAPGALGSSDVEATADGEASVGDAAVDGCMVSSNWPPVCWLHIDVTPGVQAFRSGIANHGWKLAYVSGGDPSDEKEFNSSENPGFPTLRPKLTVTYTSCPSGPYGGTPAQVPATFEAENFDCGGEGVAYHDNTPGNQSTSTYRNPESVDVMDIASGRTVQFFDTGEWMQYTINVGAAGMYGLGIFAATNEVPQGQVAGHYRMEINGVDVTGNVNVLGTGSWDTYQWFEAPASVQLAQGQYVVRLHSVQQSYRVDKLRVVTLSGCTSGPFGGTPATVPGEIEAENFDCGGEGTAYHDLTIGNQSTSPYRAGESVDVLDLPGGGRAIQYFDTGEWMQYTIDVAVAGSYRLGILAATNWAPAGQLAGQYRIEIDGVDLTGAVNVLGTGSWSTYQWTDAPARVSLSAGQHVLRLHAVQQAYRVDRLRVTAVGGCTSGPFGGTPAQMPGTVEAENFDCGGEGVAYHDNTLGNQSTSTYRNPESVDVMDMASGRTVQYFDTGEWMQYTVNVGAAGTYKVGILAATNDAPAGQVAGQYRIEINGVNVTGNVLGTGSWDTYQWFDAPTTVQLAQGQYVVRLHSVEQSYRVDKLHIVSAAAGGTGAIDRADILVWGRADVPFAQQTNYGTQVWGYHPTDGQLKSVYLQAPAIPENGIHGPQLANGATRRLGKEADPVNAGKQALAFQLALSDGTTSGKTARRSELSGATNVVFNSVYWVALKVYVYDWGNLGTSEGSLFGTQMHSGNNDLSLSPSFAIVTRDSGRNMAIEARWSTSSSPSQMNDVTARYALQPIPFGRWIDFVFKFRHNVSGSGFLQVWMDGQQIVNHTGNLGYNTPGFEDYVKFGYYNWSGSGSTPRKVLLRSPVLVADPTGSKYSHEDLRTFVRQ